MKMPILFLCLMIGFAPALAEDSQRLVERKTCEQIKTEIAELSAMGSLNSEQQAELNQLKLQQRSNCSIKGNGRRAISRSLPTVIGSENTAVAEKTDALKEYLANKKSNCEKLDSEIKKTTAEPTNSNTANGLAEMQRYYDMDCVAPTAAPVPTPATVAAAQPVPENVVPDVPMKTDEEIAAEFDANLAAGLCGDGTKPNKYGCCIDEVFTDVGDAVFACCPKTGGLCFPPIK